MFQFFGTPYYCFSPFFARYIQPSFYLTAPGDSNNNNNNVFFLNFTNVRRAINRVALIFCRLKFFLKVLLSIFCILGYMMQWAIWMGLMIGNDTGVADQAFLCRSLRILNEGGRLWGSWARHRSSVQYLKMLSCALVQHIWLTEVNWFQNYKFTLFRHFLFLIHLI